MRPVRPPLPELTELTESELTALINGLRAPTA